MLELVLIVGGILALATFVTAVKLLELGVRVVIGLIVLPFQLLGGLLALLGHLIALPFQILGWILGGVGFVIGFVLVPLLPLLLVACGILVLVGLFRSTRRPHRSRWPAHAPF